MSRLSARLICLQVYDVGGELSLRPMWQQYYDGRAAFQVRAILCDACMAGADIVVLVVNASSKVCARIIFVCDC